MYKLNNFNAQNETAFLCNDVGRSKLIFKTAYKKYFEYGFSFL